MHLMARDLACVQFERQHPQQLVRVFGAAARATTRRARAPWRPICSMTCRPRWQRASKTVDSAQATRTHWATRTGPWSTSWRCCKADICWASTPVQMSVRVPPPMPLPCGQMKQPIGRRAKCWECLCRAWCPTRLLEPAAAGAPPPCQAVLECADTRAVVMQAEHVGARIFVHGNSELPLSKNTCRLHKLIDSCVMHHASCATTNTVPREIHVKHCIQ